MATTAWQKKEEHKRIVYFGDAGLVLADSVCL